MNIKRHARMIKSGGNAKDRRRSLRAAAEIAIRMEEDHYAAGGDMPGCDHCFGSGRVYRRYDGIRGWINPKVCGCVHRLSPYRYGRIGPFRCVGKAAAKRQIGRALRGAKLDAGYWPTWWPAAKQPKNPYPRSSSAPWRKDLYDLLSDEVKLNIETLF